MIVNEGAISTVLNLKGIKFTVNKCKKKSFINSLLKQLHLNVCNKLHTMFYDQKGAIDNWCYLSYYYIEMNAFRYYLRIFRIFKRYKSSEFCWKYLRTRLWYLKQTPLTVHQCNIKRYIKRDLYEKSTQLYITDVNDIKMQ